jgi:type I restriction enzyme S subunit
MSDWKEFSIGEIADPKDRYSFSGGPFGSNLKSEEYTESGVRIIQLQNIGDGHFKDDYKIYTSEEKADELLSCNIYPGEIILSKMGDPVARATLIPDSEERYLMASDGIRLKVDPTRFDSTFILNAINSPQFRSSAEAVSVGSTRKRIGLTTLKELTIYAPPLPEQKKIAEILSGIDTAIASVKTARATLVLLKKSLSLNLLATTDDQGRQATFSDVCTRIQDGTHFSPQSKDGEHLYITSKNIRPGRLDLSSTAWISTEEHTEIYKRCPVNKGDILLTKDGANTGNACLNTLECEFSLLSSVAFIRPEPNQCDTNYMLQWILSDMFQSEIQRGMSGNAISRLTLSKIKNLSIHLPSLEKQKEIAGILSSIDNQCMSYDTKADSLLSLKHAISSDLLSGRKRVSV